MDTKDTLTLTRQEQAIAHIASKDVRRENINGVYVDSVNKRLVATDGDALAVVVKENMPESSFLLRCNKTQKRTALEEETYMLTETSTALALIEPGNSCELDRDVTYPDIDAIISERYDVDGSICIDVELLHRLACALTAKVKGKRVLKLSFKKDSKGPIYVESTTGPSYGALMPYRL